MRIELVRQPAERSKGDLASLSFYPHHPEPGGSTHRYDNKPGALDKLIDFIRRYPGPCELRGITLPDQDREAVANAVATLAQDLPLPEKYSRGIDL